MLFLWSLLLVSIYLKFFREGLVRHEGQAYVAAVIIAALLPLSAAFGLEKRIPELVWASVVSPFEKGAMAAALFTVVMYTGAARITGLYRVRKQLAVIAGIFTLGHNATYIIRTILAVKNGGGETVSGQMLPGQIQIGQIQSGQMLAARVTVIALLFLIPLWVTSFTRIRKKMSARGWKRLQRLAYPFYLLLYVHAMILFASNLERLDYRINVVVYTLVFGVYVALQLSKILGRIRGGEGIRSKGQIRSGERISLVKVLCLILAFLCVGIGAVGVVLPVLPTTPFLLLASVLFAKGSDRFHQWFISTGIYKKHLEEFVKSRSMTLKTKVSILIPASAMLLVAMLLVPYPHARIFIGLVMVFKYYYFTFRIKTIRA